MCVLPPTVHTIPTPARPFCPAALWGDTLLLLFGDTHTEPMRLDAANADGTDRHTLYTFDDGATLYGGEARPLFGYDGAGALACCGPDGLYGLRAAQGGETWSLVRIDGSGAQTVVIPDLAAALPAVQGYDAAGEPLRQRLGADAGRGSGAAGGRRAGTGALRQI